MNKYTKKQFVIGLVYFIIFALIVVGIYFLFLKSEKATCFDKIQNQGEMGVDCGKPCEECSSTEVIKILDQEFIPTVANSYDLIAYIENPNIYLGGEVLNYEFSLYDNSDQLIGVRTGKTYILSQETKYIIETRVGSDKTVSKAEFKIKDISWKKLSEIRDLDIKVKNIEYQKFDNNSKLVGLIENRTSYNLNTIEVVGVLFDESGKIIAVSKTSMNTVLMNEGRGFEMNWPYIISPEVKSFDARAYTNIFLDENFLETQDSSNPIE